MFPIPNQLSMKGEIKAYGAITYDSTANKLRFRSNESQPTNGSLGLDLLMFFNEVELTFLSWGQNLIFPRPDSWPFGCTSTGDILWDWQQEWELWEKEAALFHAPAGCSWWCKVLQLNVCWKSIHQRGGVKNQYLDGANTWLQRWERCFLNCTIELRPCWLFTHLPGYYSTSVTMGCLPLSSFYFTESGSFLFRLVFVIFIWLLCFIWLC